MPRRWTRVAFPMSSAGLSRWASRRLGLALIPRIVGQGPSRESRARGHRNYGVPTNSSAPFDS